MSIVKKITDKAKGVLLGGEPGKNSKKGEARIIGLVSEVDEEKIHGSSKNILLWI